MYNSIDGCDLMFRETLFCSLQFGELQYDNINLEFIVYGGKLFVYENSQDILISFFNKSNSEKYINIIRTLHFVQAIKSQQ